jgi:hypothetical protein
MSRRYVTVVFAINDDEEFKPQWEQFHSKMMMPATAPWSVTAMSMGDEMTRIELLESAISELDDKDEIKRVCENILSASLQSLEGKVVADFY